MNKPSKPQASSNSAATHEAQLCFTTDDLRKMPNPSGSRDVLSRFAMRVGFAALCALALALAPNAAWAQHGGGGGHVGGHFGGGHFGGGGHAAMPAARAPQHYIPVQGPRPAPVQRPVVRPAAPPRVILVPPASAHQALGNGLAQPGATPGTPPHVTIGYPPDPLAHGFTVGAPQHLPGTTVAGTVRYEGQGHDIWASPLDGVALRGRANGVPTAHLPAGWTVQSEHFRRPMPPGRGYPFHVPVTGYPLYGTGFGFVGAPFFGFPFFGYGPFFGFGLGVDASCGPYWGWGFGCYGPNYDTGYGAGYGYFLNAEPFEPSEWPSDEALQNGEPVTGPLVFPYDNPTPEETQNNFRADQNETVIFLKDGGVYLVTDYWVADGKLHYINGGGENTIPLDDIDIQKTVDVNASRGLTVTLRPSPSGAENPPAPGPPQNGPPQSMPAPNGAAPQGPAPPAR